MKIENFSQWWDINYAEYEKIGVNKIIAKSIFEAALNIAENKLLEKFGDYTLIKSK